jgi:RimJ/RimL family protein N-acetyltransferase
VLDISVIWCGYFDGNAQSKRVGEKHGFSFHHTESNKDWSLLNEIKTQHITCITKSEWRDRFNK